MFRNFKRLVFIFSVTMFVISLNVGSSVDASTSVNINGSGSGRIFDGEGVISGGGGNTKLLIDYPEPYRSDILDYLFKPNFGASYQELKVEIGGDINSTSGTEPSHARTRAENANPNMTRGYETWLINEAKKRNPNIKLSGLQWGAPGWIGDGNIWSQDNADYLVSYIKGLKNVWGYDMDYIGGNQNEHRNGTSQQARDYIVNILRPTLDNNGLSNVKISGPDILGRDWTFANQIINDPALKNAVAAIGYHYVYSSSTSNAQNSGLPIWESEGWTGIGDWKGAFELAKEMNLNYINAKITKTNVWHAISSQYNNANWAHSGIMEANTPWSGYYIVQPAIWAAAHTTQFAQPGWQYLDSGCGVTSGGTSYVTFKNPNSSDYSIVLTTGSSAESMSFNLSGGLSTGAVHVWKSNSSEQFIQESDILASGGSYSINLEPNSIYSLTTTTGQMKGVAVNPIPANHSFGNSYTENFESYDVGKTPKYLYDIEGAFETSNKYGSVTEKALRQVILKPLIQWSSWGALENPSTFTEFGDLNWQNYDYSADTLIEDSGAVYISGRVGSALPGGNVKDYHGYRLSIGSNGQWKLCYGSPYNYGLSSDIVLASGTVTGFSANTWHNLKLSFRGTSIKAYIDNNQIASVTDSRRESGMAGLGSGWNHAQFDNIHVADGNLVTNIGFNPTSYSVPVSSTVNPVVDATFFDNTTAAVIRGVTYYSSNPGVAAVHAETGVVTGISTGSANITAAYQGKTATAAVTVTPPLTPTSISFNPENYVVAVGTTVNANVNANYSDNTTRTLSSGVTYTSSKPNVAQVNATTGIVTGVSTGSTNITATYLGTTATAPVTVALPLFSDNFNDGDSVGWNGLSANWTIVIDATPGLQASNSLSESSATFGQAVSDISLQAKVKSSSMAADGSVSLMARYTDSNNFYRFGYSASSGTWNIWKKKLGAWTVLKRSAPFSFDLNSEYSLRAVLNGSALSLQLDSGSGFITLCSVTDDSFTSGLVGLLTYKSTNWYDDVIVSPLVVDPTTIPAITIDQTALSLTVGDAVAKLNATVTNSTYAPVWTSSNPQVATVNSNGEVTPLAAGTAVITVTLADGIATAQCVVTVVSANQGGQPAMALTGPSAVQIGQDLHISLGINNVSTAVYAQDIVMNYDANLFEFVSASSVKNGVNIVQQVASTPGALRLILASAGTTGAVTGDTPLVELIFKAKNRQQSAAGNIEVTSATLGDSHGNEITAATAVKRIDVQTNPLAIPGDINLDGKISIGDLSMVAAYYGKNTVSSDWEQVKAADVNHDGNIDILDLTFIAQKILE